MAPIILRRETGFVVALHMRVQSSGSIPTAENPMISPSSIALRSVSTTSKAVSLEAQGSGSDRRLLMTPSRAPLRTTHARQH